jgi:hypothetical protein
MAERFCSGCGKPLKENAQFCGNCGKQFLKGKTVESTAPPPPIAKRRTPVRLIVVILIILVIAGGALYFVFPKTGIITKLLTPAVSTGSKLGSLPTDLPASKDYRFGTVQTTATGYITTMDPLKVNKDITLKKTMVYEKQTGGMYAGTLTLQFSGSSSRPAQYTETIPKSFASDVKSLTFSVPPDTIIQSDPVVAWNNVQGQKNIVVSSSELKTQDNAKLTAENELINTSFDACDNLPSDKDRLVCKFEITRKYRDSQLVKTTIAEGDKTDPLTAAAAAIVNKDPNRYCGRLLNEQDALACRKVAFMMFVQDCNEGPAAQKPDCIRKNLWQINNYHTIIGACEYITDPAVKAECTGSVDAGYCNKIADPDLRNRCLVHAAHRQAQSSLCTGVTDAELRDLCTEQVSLYKNDQAVCSGIQDAEQRGHCIASIAATKGDIRICDMITDPGMKSACTNAAGFSAMMAGNLNNFQDLSICNTPEMQASPENRDLCINMVAVRTMNPDTCEKIADEDSKNTCFLVFSITGDTSVCTRITEDYLRDNCIKIIAEGTKDLELCNDIQGEDLLAECRNNTKHGVSGIPILTAEQIAQVRKPPAPPTNPVASVCTSPGFKLAAKVIEQDPDAVSGDTDHCYQAVAVNMGDLSLCNSIQRGAPMTKCYQMIAVKKGDASICQVIPSTSDPGQYLPLDCLMEVARSTGDPSVCGLMGNASISRMFIGEISQKSCLQQLAVGRMSSGGKST